MTCRAKAAAPLLLVVLAGLLVRVGIALALGDAPPRDDALDYELLARNLAAGHGFSLHPPEPSVFRPPLQPAFVALVYLLAGPYLLAARLAQATLSAVVIPLTYALARTFAPRRGALLAATLVAFSPALAAHASLLQTETLFSVLTAAAVLAMLRGYVAACQGAGAAAARAAFAGALLGLANLARPTLLALPLLLPPIWALLDPRHRRGAALGCVSALAALLVIAPWTVRNYAVSRALVPVALNRLGMTLWAGTYVPWRNQWKSDADRPVYLQQVDVDTVEGDRLMLGEALANIRRWPAAYLAQWPLRVFTLVRPDTSYWPFGELAGTGLWWKLPLKAGLHVAHLLTLGLGALGAIRLWRAGDLARRTAGWLMVVLGQYLLLNSLPHTEPRFLVPMLPLIAALAAGVFPARSRTGAAVDAPEAGR
jgi:4-amino-4-deoxy-L-arabinose transferase-like glycosyltransferase